MKAFIGAVSVIATLLLGVILLSGIGIRRMDEFLEAIPPEEAPLAMAAEELSALSEEVIDDLLLINAVFPHGRGDELNAAIARAAAAASANDRAEYLIMRADLDSLLRDMKRDLEPHLDDVI